MSSARAHSLRRVLTARVALRSHRSNDLEPDGPAKSMLGAEQKAALKRWLLQLESAQDPQRPTLKFLVSPQSW